MQAVDSQIADRFKISESVIWRWSTCPIEKENPLVIDITKNHRATVIEKHYSTYFLNVRCANTANNGQSRTVNYDKRIRRKTHKINIAVESDNHRIRSAEGCSTNRREITCIKSTKHGCLSSNRDYEPIVVQDQIASCYYIRR